VLDGQGVPVLCSDREGGKVMRLGARIAGFLLVGSLLVFSAPVRSQVCGDGVIDAGETCDPPNPVPNPVTHQTECRPDCTFCGDGVTQPTDFETCDLGPNLICGACLQSCIEGIFPGGGYGGCPCAFDTAAMADLRAEILAACECGNASSHGAFVRCARAKLALISPELLLPPCRHTALKFLARSVCGKHGAVTCCRTNANGRQRCVIKPDAAHCTAPLGGSASLGVSENCYDACP
jgi:hypothetical protein